MARLSLWGSCPWPLGQQRRKRSSTRFVCRASRRCEEFLPHSMGATCIQKWARRVMISKRFLLGASLAGAMFVPELVRAEMPAFLQPYVLTLEPTPSRPEAPSDPKQQSKDGEGTAEDAS